MAGTPYADGWPIVGKSLANRLRIELLWSFPEFIDRLLDDVPTTFALRLEVSRRQIVGKSSANRPRLVFESQDANAVVAISYFVLKLFK